jgi:phosphomannomutase
MEPIHFGTDGWRGVIADDFTFANVERAAQAIATTLPPDAERSVLVAYDGRFLSAAFAARVAEVMAGNDWKIRLSTGPVPTPAASVGVRHFGCAGGVVVTASHNPPRFNGIKLKAAFGGSAPPTLTGQVEQAVDRAPVRLLPLAEAQSRGRIVRVDLVPIYLDALLARLDVTRRPPRPLEVVSDSLHGACRELRAEILPRPWGTVHSLHGALDPLFGGLSPEPIPPQLDPLAETVTRLGADVGLATDGDGDRLGVIGPRGEYISPHQVLALLTLHLHRNRGWRGEVAKGFAVGVQVDRVCQALGLPLHVTPIGFKHIAELMLSRDILIGGEESGGFGIRGHLPERDGLLSALLLVEMMVAEGKGLADLIGELEALAGPAVYRRRDRYLPPAEGPRLSMCLAQASPERLAGRRVVRIEDLDGRKFWLEDGAWVVVRPSGTEPVLRVYIEASTAEEVETLHAAADDLIHRLLKGTAAGKR